MAFRVISQGQTFEVDTIAELQSLREQIGAGNAPPLTRAWNALAASECLSRLETDDRALISELMISGGVERSLAAMCVTLKREPNVFNTILRRVEHVSRVMRVVSPVRKERRTKGFVLVLDSDFAGALGSAEGS